MQVNKDGSLLISQQDAKLLMMVAVVSQYPRLLQVYDTLEWVADVGTANVFPNPDEMATFLEFRYMMPELRA